MHPKRVEIMGVRFRQSFTLFPGVRINVGKRGLSTSIGVPGATMNIGRKGVQATLGIPGTGLSYTTPRAPFSRPGKQPVARRGVAAAPTFLPDTPPANLPENARLYLPEDGMTEIASASVDVLTSPSLIPLRDMIARARAQRSEIEADLEDARRAEREQQRDLTRLRTSLLRWFYRRRIEAVEETLVTIRAEIEGLVAWSSNTKIAVDFGSGAAAGTAYDAMVRAFDRLSRSARKWDITADRATDRSAERTQATRTVTRRPVVFEFVSSEIIAFSGQAMRFENINGSDILLYPGMAVVPREDGAFALVDFRDLEITAAARSFHETESVPDDTHIIGHTWAKTNKDGSPDRRFKNNYQIPICRYGDIIFRSKSGIAEEYLVSSTESAHDFAHAVRNYQNALNEIDQPV